MVKDEPMRYSQNDEEQIIKQYFGELPGTFLSLGENDGKTLSNVYACVLRGWGGTCVEPSIRCFNRLEALHHDNPLIECFNFAVADKCGYLEFYESGEHAREYYGENHSLLSSLKKDETVKWTKETFTPTIVQTVDFKKLVERSKYKKWDLISIDCEGWDWEILIQIDLSDCKMLIIENNGTDQQKYIDYCSKFGMRLHHTTPQNLIFVK